MLPRKLPNRCHWFDCIQSNAEYLISTCFEIATAGYEENCAGRRDCEKKEGCFEYRAVVQFPVSVDPVASYLPAAARTKSGMHRMYTMTHRTLLPYLSWKISREVIDYSIKYFLLIPRSKISFFFLNCIY